MAIDAVALEFEAEQKLNLLSADKEGRGERERADREREKGIVRIADSNVEPSTRRKKLKAARFPTPFFPYLAGEKNWGFVSG